MISFLKHLNYADIICLLPHQIIVLDQVAPYLEREASKVGLKINTNKTKALSLMGQRALPIGITEQSTEGNDQFVYLGSVVSADGGTELDVARRINSAKSAFAALSKIW